MMSILRRFVAPLKSRKVRTALAAVFAAYFGQRWEFLDAPTIYVLLGVAVAFILGVAIEDAGLKASGRSHNPPNGLDLRACGDVKRVPASWGKAYTRPPFEVEDDS